MAKLVLTDTATGYQTAYAVNANNAAIVAAVEDSLSRSGFGNSDNKMDTQIDMNGHYILNLGAPQGPNDAARLLDLQNVSAIIGTAVPPQGAAAGQFLGTDGSSLIFARPLADPTGQAGKQLESDGTITSWQARIPAQTANVGKFLQTDGANTSWQLPLPDQTGNSSKFLQTNGSSLLWTALAGTGNAIKTANQSIANTTLAADTELTVTLSATGWYNFRALLFINSTNAGNGFKYQWGGTATQVQGRWTDHGTNNAAVLLNNFATIGALGTHSAASLTQDSLFLNGFIQVSSIGTFFLNWAMNSLVSGNTSVLAGSWLTTTKIA